MMKVKWMPFAVIAIALVSRHAEDMFWEYWDMSAVRHGQFKLLKPREDQPFRLYDLEYDVGETYDIADGKPEIAAKLEQAYRQWIDEVDQILQAHAARRMAACHARKMDGSTGLTFAS